jgi:predicted flap endonuclease-1-like 5' DNA nuclease
MAGVVQNPEIAQALERVADLLEAQDADPFRVRAWRRAAETVRAHPTPLAALVAESGLAGLDRLPGIGRSLASAIEELVRTGRLRMLERLEGEVAPEDLLTTLPGIGEALARRIVDLGIHTLEELELAAYDGRLAAVPGFGARRVRAVQAALAGILGASARRRAGAARRRAAGEEATPAERPEVAALLAVDAEYRRRAEAGELRRIRPRRFNPAGTAWLPVLHAERDGWTVSALYSNTARAHELGKTHDWVVIYFERDGVEEQCTVVTESSGPLAGRRVVRGREAECRRHYAEIERAGAA